MALDIDTIRVLVGDNDAASQLIDDDSIELIIDGYTSTRLAAAAVADAISAKFSRKVSFSLEGLRFENSTKADAYRLLADRLRAEAANAESGSLGAMISGISVSEEQTQDDNDDRTPSIFKTGMQQ